MWGRSLLSRQPGLVGLVLLASVVLLAAFVLQLGLKAVEALVEFFKPRVHLAAQGQDVAADMFGKLFVGHGRRARLSL